MMKTVLQKIDALPAHIRSQPLIAEWRDLESRRAADPAWQARQKAIRAEYRRSLAKWLGLMVLAVLAIHTFLWFDPFGAATAIAKFTWTYFELMLAGSAVGILATLILASPDFERPAWAEPILSWLAGVGMLLALCMTALIGRFVFSML
jgi:cytosine/uracil/thiamine/allantoin permease